MHITHTQKCLCILIKCPCQVKLTFCPPWMVLGQIYQNKVERASLSRQGWVPQTQPSHQFCH